MKKSLAILSIALFFLIYSAALTLFGTYGIRNSDAYHSHAAYLRETREQMRVTVSRLQERKELLGNPRYAFTLGQRYGYVLPGEKLIISTQQDVRPQGPSEYSRIPVLEKQIRTPSITLLFSISLGVSLLFYLLSSLLVAKRSRG